MFNLILSELFDKTFSKLKDNPAKKQIWKKILELENRAPIGKKLRGNPYWSIHIGRYRIIYELKGNQVIIADILLRKQGYREI